MGVRVDSERARRVFARATGRAAIAGDRVFIPPELVEWALRTAPSRLEIYRRQGDLALRLGPDQTRCGIGPGGHYLTSDLTLQRLHQVYYRSAM